MQRFIISVAAVAIFSVSGGAVAREAPSLHSELEQLARDGRFSGAVVIRDAREVRFAQGYGLADPFTGRRFTPDTAVDSGSLSKPVTATVVLWLANAGKLDLDAPVQRYLPGYPHQQTTVRHLLSHSAGLPSDEVLEPLAGKTNEMLVNEVAARRLPPAFTPGSGFAYCNYCYSTLALMIERVGGVPYLTSAASQARLPAGVTIRPLHLADWPERAIGYHRARDGRIERADSYESEAFYGSGNLSISAAQLARWGVEWWGPALAPIRTLATTPARIDDKTSGLTWGNWYCARDAQRCHYLGHHEGFHHMLYWDAGQRVAVAMVSNNTLAPDLQQRLQRALVAFASDDASAGAREIAAPLPDTPVQPGRYTFATGETIAIAADGKVMWVERAGLRYRAYLISAGIRYVPGLDIYLAGAGERSLHWLGLYEDLVGEMK